MGWWSYCNMEVLGAPPSVYGMVEVSLREEFSLIPEGFQFMWEWWGEAGGAVEGLAGCQQRSQNGRSAGAGEGQGVCVSQWGAAVGMGTVGRAVALNSPNMRMTLGSWGKAKVVEALLANRVSPFGKEYFSGKHGCKGYALWWILCWFWWLRSPPSSTQSMDPIKAHLIPCKGSWRIT